jgi:hypothetical protein
VVISGEILAALGFYIVFLVYKDDSFTLVIIEVAGYQK